MLSNLLKTNSKILSLWIRPELTRKVNKRNTIVHTGRLNVPTARQKRLWISLPLNSSIEMSALRYGMVALKKNQNKAKTSKWRNSMRDCECFQSLAIFGDKRFVFLNLQGIKLRYWNTASIAKVIYGNITLALKKIQMKPRRSDFAPWRQQSSCVCCSLEWLPPRRHLFAYEPSGNNGKSPHLLCEMNSVPLTHNPRTDRLCLSCRLPLAATRGSHKDVIRWWVGYLKPNPEKKKQPC